ncbi:hypothetical protein IB024_01875 [Brucella sp. 6810]|uniref:hypothetical protein n=1 Tax=Brucella sp. 6810 TaxID=2769351 RepID=UPI00165C10B3|nr:hypothetical protein [Brucella sp. 6810]QNQ62531.1 hypothetical protein IB024_01875 [Brucella sp. 6810]
MTVFTYFISFRIDASTRKGKTYNDRRESLIAAAREANAGFWDATTSFIIAESLLSTGGFAAKLTKELDENHDMLVVFDPSDMSMVYFGDVNEPEVLCSFFKIPKKLP